MAKSEVITLLEKYHTIGSDNLELIHHLQQRYPWFSAAYTLESKCLFNENKPGYKKALKKAATFTGNREVLYDFMHNAIDFKPNEAAVSEAAQPVSKEELPKPTEEEVRATPEERTPLPEPVYDPIAELSKLVDDEEVQPEQKPAYDPLVELPKLEQKEKKQKKSEKQDFFGWLDRFSEEEEAEAPKPRKLQMTKEAAELLDNFIKNRPSISKIRKDVDRLDVYKASNEDPSIGIVSESLAQLHLKQERPELALDVYKKMQLQNPQKFSYFAALIEKIQEEHNLE